MILSAFFCSKMLSINLTDILATFFLFDMPLGSEQDELCGIQSTYSHLWVKLIQNLLYLNSLQLHSSRHALFEILNDSSVVFYTRCVVYCMWVTVFKSMQAYMFRDIICYFDHTLIVRMCMCTLAIKDVIEIYKIKGHLQKALYDEEVSRKYLYDM